MRKPERFAFRVAKLLAVDEPVQQPVAIPFGGANSEPEREPECEPECEPKRLAIAITKRKLVVRGCDGAAAGAPATALPASAAPSRRRPCSTALRRKMPPCK